MKAYPIKLPNPPTEHAGCAAWLKAGFAQMGCDATVSEAAPLVPTPYLSDPFFCPHGVVLWHAPTSEQIAAWNSEGVA